MTSAVAAPAARPAKTRRVWLPGLLAVLERDFLVFTSQPRFLVVRTLAVMLPAGVLLTVLGVNSSRNAMGSSGLGTIVFATSTVLVPTLVALLSPVLAASCIASERALNTLQIVLASPVSPLAFVLAKFLSRFGVVLVLVLATLPLSGLCFLYGGVSGTSFADFLAFVTGLALFGTAAGIVASAWCRRVSTATTVAYLLAIVVPVAHFAIAMTLMSRSGSIRTFPQYDYLLELNPIAAWVGITMRAASAFAAGNAGLVFLTWTLLTVAVAIGFAAWRVGREAAQESSAGGGPRSARTIQYENPVLDRSLRGSLLNRPRFRAWLPLVFVLAVDALILWIAGFNSLTDKGPHLALLCITTFVAALSAMTAAAHSIASEREAGALDLLLASRLTTPEVVRGKYAGVLLTVAPVVAVALVHGIVAARFTELGLAAVLAWLVGTLVVTLLFTAVGLWRSSRDPTSGRAVLRSYALLIGGSVVHAVGSGILMLVIGFMHVSDLYAYIWGASPLFIGIAGPSLASSNHWSDNETHMLVSWVLWSAVYVFFAFRLLVRTVSALEMRNEAG